VGGASLLRRRKETGLFTVLTVVSLLVALGDSTPIGRRALLAAACVPRNGMHPEFASALLRFGRRGAGGPGGGQLVQGCGRWLTLPWRWWRWI